MQTLEKLILPTAIAQWSKRLKFPMVTLAAMPNQWRFVALPLALVWGWRCMSGIEAGTAALELQSTRLRWAAAVEIAAAKEILQTIEERAIALWKDKWIAELVKAYVKISIANGDEGATVVNRRPQIERAFKSKSCKLDTAIVLAAAVGCRFQLSCTNVEIKEF